MRGNGKGDVGHVGDGTADVEAEGVVEEQRSTARQGVKRPLALDDVDVFRSRGKDHRAGFAGIDAYIGETDVGGDRFAIVKRRTAIVSGKAVDGYER